LKGRTCRFDPKGAKERKGRRKTTSRAKDGRGEPQTLEGNDRIAKRAQQAGKGDWFS